MHTITVGKLKCIHNILNILCYLCGTSDRNIVFSHNCQYFNRFKYSNDLLIYVTINSFTFVSCFFILILYTEIRTAVMWGIICLSAYFHNLF